MVEYENRMGYRMSPKFYCVPLIYCLTGIYLFDMGKFERDFCWFGVTVSVIGLISSNR